MKVIGIAAITLDEYISKNRQDKVLWSKDKKLFKKQTMNSTLIMGSTTRTNISSKLKGRKVIVVHREDIPLDILKKVNNNKCFVVGGAQTFTRFYKYLTHLYLTPHPLIFGKGIKLFNDIKTKLFLNLEKQIPIDDGQQIFQMQYKIIS